MTRGIASDSTGAEPPHLAGLAERASSEARGVSADLLNGYPTLLAGVSTGGRLGVAVLGAKLLGWPEDS